MQQRHYTTSDIQGSGEHELSHHAQTLERFPLDVTQPLEAHEQWLLDLVAAEPDLTLEEIRARLRSEKKLKAGTTSIWRFYDRHAITFKKNSARRRTGSS